MKQKIKSIIEKRSSKISTLVERSAKRRAYKLKYWQETLSAAALSTLPSAVAKLLKTKRTRTR